MFLAEVNESPLTAFKIGVAEKKQKHMDKLFCPTPTTGSSIPRSAEKVRKLF
jgi:hypothetical protein